MSSLTCSNHLGPWLPDGCSKSVKAWSLAEKHILFKTSFLKKYLFFWFSSIYDGLSKTTTHILMNFHTFDKLKCKCQAFCLFSQLLSCKMFWKRVILEQKTTSQTHTYGRMDNTYFLFCHLFNKICLFIIFSQP